MLRSSILWLRRPYGIPRHWALASGYFHFVQKCQVVRKEIVKSKTVLKDKLSEPFLISGKHSGREML